MHNGDEPSLFQLITSFWNQLGPLTRVVVFVFFISIAMSLKNGETFIKSLAKALICVLISYSLFPILKSFCAYAIATYGFIPKDIDPSAAANSICCMMAVMGIDWMRDRLSNVFDRFTNKRGDQ